MEELPQVVVVEAFLEVKVVVEPYARQVEVREEEQKAEVLTKV